MTGMAAGCERAGITVQTTVAAPSKRDEPRRLIRSTASA